MLNNEFCLVGIATSNVWLDNSGSFPIRYITVEVEKRIGKNKGIVNKATCVIYNGNTAVKTDTEYKGKIVAINGYLDIRENVKDFKKPYIQLIVQDIVIIGDAVVNEEAKPLEMDEDEYPF